VQRIAKKGTRNISRALASSNEFKINGASTSNSSIRKFSTHQALTGSLVPPELDNYANFSPGPCNLPPPVETAIRDAINKQGPTSLALSHRSPEFLDIMGDAVDKIRSVMSVPDNYEIIFTHGGGHGQFASVPLNLTNAPDDLVSYIISGTWSERAIVDANKYCKTEVIKGDYKSMPEIAGKVNKDSKFVYLCSNETVNGIEVFDLPTSEETNGVPLVVDASSDFSSKPICWDNVGVLFSCASKNIGHPGITVTIIRKDLLGSPSPYCPGVFDWTMNVEAENLWNTVATFNVEVVKFAFDWIESEGGIVEMERRSKAKADLIYNVLDESDGYYGTPVTDKNVRSRMNVPFKIAGGDEALTEKFLIDGFDKHSFVGFRTMTPFGFGEYLRASLYHGIDVNQTERLADFMRTFQKENQ